MVELAFSTNAYTQYSLLEAVERIEEHGYTGVEILGDEPHAYFLTFDAEDRNALETRIAALDLSVSNINANTAMGYYDDAPPSAFFEPSIITADDEARTWRIEYTKRAIDLAATMDAPAVCVATGRPLPGNPPERAREYLHQSLHDILDYAERRDVELGIEFEPELLIENTSEVLELIDEIDRSALGVNLDVGHAAVYGEEIEESIHRCAGHITGIHLEDIVGGRRGKHYHRVPGEGDIDFASIFDALADIGYDGYTTLELYTYPESPDSAAERAYDELSSLV